MIQSLVIFFVLHGNVVGQKRARIGTLGRRPFIVGGRFGQVAVNH